MDMPSDLCHRAKRQARPHQSNRRANGAGSRQRSGTLWQIRGQSQAGSARPVEVAARCQVRRCNRHNAYAAGRRQIHHHRRHRPGDEAHRQEGHHHRAAAIAGPDLRHQRRGSRRRLQPDCADGEFQSAPHRRHPRHQRRAQLDLGDAGRPCLSRQRAGHRHSQYPLAPGGRSERPRVAQRHRRLGQTL